MRLWDSIALDKLVEYIDWSPFFWTWELKGTYPRILEHKERGAQAKELFADAQRLLEDIVTNKQFEAKAVTGSGLPAEMGMMFVSLMPTLQSRKSRSFIFYVSKSKVLLNLSSRWLTLSLRQNRDAIVWAASR